VLSVGSTRGVLAGCGRGKARARLGVGELARGGHDAGDVASLRASTALHRALAPGAELPHEGRAFLHNSTVALSATNATARRVDRQHDRDTHRQRQMVTKQVDSQLDQHAVQGLRRTWGLHVLVRKAAVAVTVLLRSSRSSWTEAPSQASSGRFFTAEVGSWFWQTSFATWVPLLQGRVQVLQAPRE
jgi:hypothetical protein